MRTILLLLFTSSLITGSSLSQVGDAPAALYAGADVIFDGHLETIAPSSSGLTARFSVTQVIKGQATTSKGVQIHLPTDSRCHAFEENHRYLVYGRKIDSQLWVDPCEGSKLYSQAESDLQYIHTINAKVSEQCNRLRLKRLAKTSAIVATAKIMGTEDTLGPTPTFRPWCGLVLTTEYAYYQVLDVMKGQIPDSKIAVEHAICWDTITIDGYSARLSPELFREGNVLLLFLKKGSHREEQVPPPFRSGYEDIDENCGAISAESDAAQGVVASLRNPK